MHINELQQTGTLHVAGGGFADVYKGKMDNGQVVALKVPRNFGTNEQLRKVHAVGRLVIDISMFLTRV